MECFSGLVKTTLSLSPFEQKETLNSARVVDARGRSMTIRTKPNLEQLMNARRPLLFSRMPRMLSDDGQMARSLLHRFRYFEGIETHPAQLSVRRWNVVLQKSRALGVQRRRADRAR